MIQDHNIKIPEQEYRDLDIPSYSMLSAISKQGIDIVEGVKVGHFNLIFGSLVDDMCFEPLILKDKYYAGVAPKSPTPNIKKILDKVLSDIIGNEGDDYEQEGLLGKKKQMIVSSDIEMYKSEIIRAAIDLKLYPKYTTDKVEKTVCKGGAEYFEDNILARGKQLVKPEMWAKAFQTAETLITHPFSSKYFDHDQKGIEIIYQYKFVTKVYGKKVKGMLDCVLIDHNSKIIYPVDLKTGEAPAECFDEVILLHKYYLQGALYRAALMNIVKNDPDLKGYGVAEFEFLYISKLNPYKPLIWIMTEKFHSQAFNGFVDRYGFKHKGVYELIDEYYACKEGRYCQYTEEQYDNEGRIMLDDLVKNDDEGNNNRNSAE